MENTFTINLAAKSEKLNLKFKITNKQPKYDVEIYGNPV